MSKEIALVIIGFLSIGHAAFLSVFLLSLKSRQAVSNRILGLFLLSLAIRISKSVIIVAFPNSSPMFIGFGLAGLVAIGPLLWLHIMALSNQKVVVKNYLHLVPASLILILTPSLVEPFLYYIYVFGTIHMGIYLLVCIRYRRMKLSNNLFTNNYSNWSHKLILGSILIWLLFLVQLTLDTYLSYFIATSIAALVLYSLSFYAFKQNQVFRGRRRATKTGDLQSIANLIETLFINQKVYRTRELTINKIGNQLGIKPYLVSQAINDSFDKSLPELINSYRLAEVRATLESRKSDHLSIEAIASDAGFNALSTFYTSFKKTYSITPAEYRRQFFAYQKE